MTYLPPAAAPSNNPGLIGALNSANALMAAQPISQVQTFANPTSVATAWDWRTGSFQPVSQSGVQVQPSAEQPVGVPAALLSLPQPYTPPGTQPTYANPLDAQGNPVANWWGQPAVADPTRLAPSLPGGSTGGRAQLGFPTPAPAVGAFQQATSPQSQQNTGLSGWGGHKWWSAQPTAGGALST